MTCEKVIDLATPIRSEQVRDFQPPWRTVWIYRCGECGAEHRIRNNSWIGKHPTPGVGGIVCGREKVSR